MRRRLEARWLASVAADIRRLRVGVSVVRNSQRRAVHSGSGGSSRHTFACLPAICGAVGLSENRRSLWLRSVVELCCGSKWTRWNLWLHGQALTGARHSPVLLYVSRVDIEEAAAKTVGVVRRRCWIGHRSQLCYSTYISSRRTMPPHPHRPHQPHLARAALRPSKRQSRYLLYLCVICVYMYIDI